MLFLLPWLALADDFRVGPGERFETLAEALPYTAAYDRILLVPGFHLADVEILDPLTIEGTGPGVVLVGSSEATLTFRAGGRLRNLEIAPMSGSAVVSQGGSLRAEGVTLLGGFADEGAGYRVLGGRLTVLGGRVEGAIADRGAGLYVGPAADKVELDGVIFRSNLALGEGGGAIYQEGGWLRVHGVAFEQNVSLADGGGWLIRGGRGALVSDSVWCANQASGRGGALAADHPVWTLSVQHAAFWDNRADVAGGAVFASEVFLFDLFDATLLDNVAPVGSHGVDDTVSGVLRHSVLGWASNPASGWVGASGGANLFHLSDPTDGGLHPRDVLGEPTFLDYRRDRACDDDLRPALDSPAKDAGPLRDPDGSRSDLGYPYN